MGYIKHNNKPTGLITNNLSSNYDPRKDNEYMSSNMLRFFKNKLEEMHKEIVVKENAISHSIVDQPNISPDILDKGAVEESLFNDFMLQEHDDRLRHEVEEALERINKGTYGYCLETNEAIGVDRLLSVPTAKYTMDVQKAKEQPKV